MKIEKELVDFGEDLRLLKNGKKVSRKGWNGSGMYASAENWPRPPSQKTPCLRSFWSTPPTL